MQSGKTNLHINKKATFEQLFYILNPYNKLLPLDDPGQNPTDFTGCAGTALIKDKVGGTTLATFTVTFPVPEKGQVKLSLTAAQTTSLSFKTGVWDLFVTFPSGKVVKYLEGNVVLDPNVS